LSVSARTHSRRIDNLIAAEAGILFGAAMRYLCKLTYHSSHQAGPGGSLRDAKVPSSPLI